MHRSLRSFLLTTLMLALAFAAKAANADATLRAFPGAEGFGATTPGGRGGRVFLVTSLADAGPGTLREACEASGPRIVIFRTSGTIRLQRPITIREPYITIAGQTAPGGGICLRDQSLGVATHDVVIRYLRSRLGDVSGQQDDCIDLLHGAQNCVIDHCSATWSIDECLSLSGKVQNCTVQWCLIGESLRQSKHKKGAHGFGSLARANGPISLHHNLWLHNDARNPRLGDNYGRSATSPFFDVRNNIIYNFGGTASGLTQGKFAVNYVDNYIRPGPSSRARTPISIGTPSELRFFLRGNIFEGHDELTADNARFFDRTEIDDRKQVTVVDEPFAAAPVTTVPAAELLERVLPTVGASRPERDSVDARLVDHVRTRTGKLIDSQADVGGWPELARGEPPADSDRDGMPDEWETAHGLNPNDASDAVRRAASGYTNVEEFINELAVAPLP
jgi:pectate lyase